MLCPHGLCFPFKTTLRMTGKVCLIWVYFSEIQPVGVLAPFPVPPRVGLFHPPSLRGLLAGWSQTSVSPSLSPQELGRLPSLIWCWSNISLPVLVSQTLGKSCLRPGRPLLSKGPECGAVPPTLEPNPHGLCLPGSGSPPEGAVPPFSAGSGWGETANTRWGGPMLRGGSSHSFCCLPLASFLLHVSSLGRGRTGLVKKCSEEDEREAEVRGPGMAPGLRLLSLVDTPHPLACVLAASPRTPVRRASQNRRLQS